MPRTELGKMPPGRAGESFLAFMNGGRTVVEDLVWAQLCLGLAHDSLVDGIQALLLRASRRRDAGPATLGSEQQSTFHLAGARSFTEKTVAGVGRGLSLDEAASCQEMVVIRHREEHRLLVKMVLTRHGVAASGDAQSSILDALKVGGPGVVQ